MTFFQTGSQQAGRPSIGAWLSYGLGSDNSNLPAFIVLLSRAREGDQPLYSWLWGSGFLPSQHQGVQFRGGKDPVLYLSDPDGMSRTTRRRMLDTLRALEDARARAGDGSRDRRARRAVRDGVSDAGGGARGDGPEGRARRDVRPLWRRCAQARHVRGQLPARAAAGRAQRAVHPALSPGLGSARRPAAGHPDHDEVGGPGVGGAGASI